MRVSKLNEAVAQKGKILQHHKRVDRTISDIQKSISLANCKCEFKMLERIWVFISPQESSKRCQRCYLFYDKCYSFLFCRMERSSKTSSEWRSLKPLWFRTDIIWISLWKKYEWKFEIGQRKLESVTEFGKYQIQE